MALAAGFFIQRFGTSLALTGSPVGAMKIFAVSRLRPADWLVYEAS